MQKVAFLAVLGIILIAITFPCVASINAMLIRNNALIIIILDENKIIK